jgi:hypothetical protein
MSADKANCQNCGGEFPIDELDAKPGPGHWTVEQLVDAADAGRDFVRIECRSCYGPGWLPARA